MHDNMAAIAVVLCRNDGVAAGQVALLRRIAAGHPMLKGAADGATRLMVVAAPPGGGLRRGRRCRHFYTSAESSAGIAFPGNHSFIMP
jgi:hypothetical protein